MVLEVYEVKQFVLKHLLGFTNIMNGVLAGACPDKDMRLASLFHKRKCAMILATYLGEPGPS